MLYIHYLRCRGGWLVGGESEIWIEINLSCCGRWWCGAVLGCTYVQYILLEKVSQSSFRYICTYHIVWIHEWR
jgi:hypothetical protein